MLQASREHTWSTVRGKRGRRQCPARRAAHLPGKGWMLRGCSLLHCPGKIQESNQKRGQQQRAASEPATHANNTLACPREIFRPLQRARTLVRPIPGCPEWAPQPQKASLAHSAILSPGDGVRGLLMEIRLGLSITKRQLLLCSLAPLPSPVPSAEAVTLQQDSLT